MTSDPFATATFVEQRRGQSSTPISLIYNSSARSSVTRPDPPLRVLLGAFVCAPGLGSEEGVGWGVAWSLAQLHRVHVLTTPRHRDAIELHMADHPCENLTFSYFDFSPGIVSCVVTSALWQLYYHAWQCRIGTWARSVAEAFAPDVVQHLTYGRYWTPTTLWKLGRPFLWGPVGGGDECPKEFLPLLPWRDRVSEFARRFAQMLAHCDSRLQDTARHCDAALASTVATAGRLRTLGCPRVEMLLQMAVDEDLLNQPMGLPDESPTFCTVGRLLGWKGQILALQAFAQARIPRGQLVVIGEGPVKIRLQREARRLGIGHQVNFAGALSRRSTLEWMRRSTALLHTSFHDQAPTVIFEAMAVGTPVIALALGGVPFQVTAATGFPIQAHNPLQAVRDLAIAVQSITSSPRLRQRCAQAGRESIRHGYTWGRKATQFADLYKTLLEPSRPGYKIPA